MSRYRTIVADPPWHYPSSLPDRGAAVAFLSLPGGWGWRIDYWGYVVCDLPAWWWA